MYKYVNAKSFHPKVLVQSFNNICLSESFLSKGNINNKLPPHMRGAGEAEMLRDAITTAVRAEALLCANISVLIKCLICQVLIY